LTDKENKINNIKLLFLFYAFSAAVLIYWIINSDGFYFIDDSCHYNYNRHFLDTYEGSVSSWHRFGRVLLFFIPSLFGLKATQIFSAVIYLITIHFAYKILEYYKIRYREWVILLIAFQPVLFNISYTVLAELPTAALLTTGFYYYLRRKPITVMVLSSIIILFRTEMFFAAGIYFTIFLFQKKWKSLPFILTGPLIWFIFAWIFRGYPEAIFYELTLHSRLERITEGIDFQYYFYYSPKIFGLLQTVFFILGTIFLIIRKKIKDYLILYLIIFGCILGNTVAALKGAEITCSTGQLRYVAVVGPLIGIIAAVGLSYISVNIKNKALLIISAIMTASVLFFLGPYVTPYHSKYEIEKISDNIVYTVKNYYPEYKIITNLHQIANSLDEPASGGDTYKTLTKTNLEKYKKAIIVWEKSLEGSPFVEENVMLNDILELENIRLLDSIRTTVSHDIDFPVFRFRTPEKSFLNDKIDYFIADQNCWEEIKIKIFIKD